MNIPMMKQPESILTILRRTIPFLYYCFKRSSKCMKSKIKLMNKKQKKQAKGNIVVDWTRMLITRRGAMMETWSDRKLLYSVKKRTIVFWEGVNSPRNFVKLFLPLMLLFNFQTPLLKESLSSISDVLCGAQLRTSPDGCWTLQNPHIYSLIPLLKLSLNETWPISFIPQAIWIG